LERNRRIDLHVRAVAAVDEPREPQSTTGRPHKIAADLTGSDLTRAGHGSEISGRRLGIVVRRPASLSRRRRYIRVDGYRFEPGGLAHFDRPLLRASDFERRFRLVRRLGARSKFVLDER